MITLTRPLTAFDVETTTPNPTTARIVQIAIIRLHPSGERDTYSTLVNPEVPIPPDSTAIHGITDEMVKGKPTFKMLAPRLIRAFTNCDLLGYNAARFDIPVIGEEFKRAGIDTSVPEGQAPPRILDPYVIWQKKESRTLGDAVKKFLGREHEGAHDALADVEATLEIAEHMIGVYWPDLPQTLDELHAYQFPKNPNAIDAAAKFVWSGTTPVIAFSKHQGSSLPHLVANERGFLTWMLKSDFADDTKAIVRDALQGRYPVKEAA